MFIQYLATFVDFKNEKENRITAMSNNFKDAEVASTLLTIFLSICHLLDSFVVSVYCIDEQCRYSRAFKQFLTLLYTIHTIVDCTHVYNNIELHKELTYHVMSYCTTQVNMLLNTEFTASFTASNTSSFKISKIEN